MRLHDQLIVQKPSFPERDSSTGALLGEGPASNTCVQVRSREAPAGRAAGGRIRPNSKEEGLGRAAEGGQRSVCAVSGHRPGLSCTRQKHAVPDRPRAKAVSAPRSSSWVKMFRFGGFVMSYPPAEGSVSRDSLTKPFRFNSTPVLKRQVIGGHRHPPPPPPPPLQGAAGSGGDAAEPGLHPAPSECRPVAPGGGRGGGSCVRVSSRGVLGLPRLGLPVCSSPW